MTHTRHILLCTLMLGALTALPSCRAKRHTTHEANVQDSIQLERLITTEHRQSQESDRQVQTAIDTHEWAVVERFDTLGRITERLTKGRTAKATQTAQETTTQQADLLTIDTTSYRHASTATERTATQQEAQALGGGFSLSWMLGGAVFGFALCAYILYRYRPRRT